MVDESDDRDAKRCWEKGRKSHMFVYKYDARFDHATFSGLADLLCFGKGMLCLVKSVHVEHDVIRSVYEKSLPRTARA